MSSKISSITQNRQLRAFHESILIFTHLGLEIIRLLSDIIFPVLLRALEVESDQKTEGGMSQLLHPFLFI